MNDPTIADAGRPTRAEVDLARLRRNLEAIQRRVAPAGTMAVVKANAYGHGLAVVAPHLAAWGVDRLGVAVLEEGLFLRELGIELPILVLGGILGDQIPLFLKHDLALTASSVEQLEQVDEAASRLGARARVHLKIDTGMGRLGVHHDSAGPFLEASLRYRHLRVEGIFSHFANADARDLSSARLQLERFQEVLRFYERRSLPCPLRHMANSGAILQLPEAYLDVVRPGILLYGVYPSEEAARTVAVEPALAWKSRVVHSKEVRAGRPVSYGWTWAPDHDVRVVTVPVGYGDGYLRAMSNRGEVLIHGRRYPTVGRICMDQILVSVEGDSARNGDEVVLLGEAGDARITAEDLARWAGTIPYEILTNINTRVPRVYYGG